jgi:MoaA/NifB/PqqE/SkfB family radical SAM enzyme
MLIERLPILILCPHSRCNCRCVMCDIWKSDRVQEIGTAFLDRHLGDIQALGVEWVVFSGGEPLLHSDLFPLCERLRRLGIRITILSTGLLIEKHAAAIVAHTDDVIVSLDGPPGVHDRIRRVPHAFDQLAGGVRALHRLSPAFPVAARCTVQKLNYNRLRETVQVARALNLVSISFLAADLTSTAFNRPQGWPPERRAEVALTADEVCELESEVNALLAEANGGFVLESPEKLRRIVRHFQAQLGMIEPVAPRCNAPWVSAVVESDGTVRPCFFHRPIGRLGEQSLQEAVNGKEAVRFRRSLDIPKDPVCRRCVCSLWRSAPTAKP